MVIYKYELKITDRQEIYLPQGFRILSVDQQSGELFLWAVVMPKEELVCPVQIFIAGTWNPIPSEFAGWTFLGTVQILGFVWHVFSEPQDL